MSFDCVRRAAAGWAEAKGDNEKTAASSVDTATKLLPSSRDSISARLTLFFKAVKPVFDDNNNDKGSLGSLGRLCAATVRLRNNSYCPRLAGCALAPSHIVTGKGEWGKQPGSS